jgi:hypothetical protein
MKKLLPILVLFFCLHSLALLAADKPHAVIKNATWDFGFVPQKSKVSHTFYLYNIGTSPLNVQKIKSGCTCAGVTEIEKPIPPGDSAAVVVTFNTGRYHSKTGKTIIIFSDDPDSSVLFIDIRAEVQKNDEPTGDIAIKPRKLFIKINEDGAIVGFDSLEIKNNGSDTMSIKVLHASDNIINQIKVPNVVAPGEIIHPSLTLTGDALSEDIKGASITFDFTGQDTIIVTVPIEIKND